MCGMAWSIGQTRPNSVGPGQRPTSRVKKICACCAMDGALGGVCRLAREADRLRAGVQSRGAEIRKSLGLLRTSKLIAVNTHLIYAPRLRRVRSQKLSQSPEQIGLDLCPQNLGTDVFRVSPDLAIPALCAPDAFDATRCAAMAELPLRLKSNRNTAAGTVKSLNSAYCPLSQSISVPFRKSMSRGVGSPRLPNAGVRLPMGSRWPVEPLLA